MADTNENENHPTITVDGKELKVVGGPEDVSRFQVGDLVQVDLRMNGQVFDEKPHEERGLVVALNYKDEEFFYHMPVVQFESELRMFNPDILFVVQRADGTPGEIERMEESERATEEHRTNQAKESKEG